MNEQPPKSRRRWFSFSLRSMMLLVVVIAIPLGWKVNRARNQRVVVAELQKLTVTDIAYDYQFVAMKNGRGKSLPPGPGWLIDLLGEEYFVEVVQIAVDDPQVTDETIALIARLPKIERVTLKSDRITDGGLVHFAGMHNLEVVTLYSNRITGAGLVHLAELKRLKWLDVWGWATDDSLEHISTLKRLENLHVIEPSQVTDRGLANVAKLTNLQSLHLGNDPRNTAGLQDYIKITDAGLGNLYGLKNLVSLRLNTTQVTQTGIDKLQKALPNCKIEWNPMRPNDSE